jgi:stalled ribosome rescue protein Dom34
MSKQVIVWIDHKQARLFDLQLDGIEPTTVTAPHGTHHRHAKGPDGTKEHPNDAKVFFEEVAGSLGQAEQILVVGPSSARLEFGRYLSEHAHAIEARIVGSETVDHPSDGQLVAYAKKHFHISDRGA